MLNTHKLLYILPDVAYVAELLPAKKPHSFTIQEFRQVNGEYLNDQGFIDKNVIKLVGKLEAEEYHLILPDDLFTNTIVTVEESEQKKIEAHINETLLPQLDISKDTHQISVSKLTTLKGQSRVQLSAIEQSVLSPLKTGSEKSDCKLVGISPLSWTVKSVVSLEPSVTILQMGSNLFSALHYIGVDQAFHTEVSDIEAIAETIKTLKGSEPNIQTIYLVTNSVVEEKLKELLSDTLPLQQLNPLKEDESKIPPYVKYAIEAGQKTLSISDYPVPKFTLEKVTASKVSSSDAIDPAETEPDAEADKPLSLEPADAQPELPQPSTPQVAATVVSDKDSEPMPDAASTKTKADAVAVDATVENEAETATDSTPKESSPTEAPAKTTAAPADPKAESTSTKEPETIAVEPGSAATPAATATETPVPATESDSTSVSDTSNQPTGDVDLSQFAVHPTADAATTSPAQESAQAAASKPIKNQSGTGSMIRMIVITIVVFIATVAVGVGIGFGLLTLSKSKAPETPTPTEETEMAPTAAPEPSPEASASAEMAPEDMSLLVVNATTKAGYAGTIKSDLEEAGFGTVEAGNAKGEYDDAENNLVLMEEMDAGVIELLEKATDLGLAYEEGYSTEDANGTYDAVIVLTK